MIKGKSHVLSGSKQFKALAETSTSRKIKMLQSDNEREYCNKEFDDFLRENSITRRLLTSYTPQQNGVAERKNRTLKMARCMMCEAEIPPSF